MATEEVVPGHRVRAGPVGVHLPGPGGDNVNSWIPSHSLSAAGFALAVVFSLQGLTGWATVDVDSFKDLPD